MVVFCQETIDKETDEILDSILMDNKSLDSLLTKISPPSFLYVVVNYDDDVYFSGRDIELDQYSVRPQITYVTPKGFYANISGAYYSEFSPNWDYTAMSVGYGRSIGKKKVFRWSASYRKYLYSDGVVNPFDHTFQASIDATNKKKKIGIGLSGTYLFGEDQSFQFSLRSYKTVQLFKSTKTALSIRPQLAIVVGEFTFELAQRTFQNGNIVIDYIQDNTFDLINTQIKLPLQYNYNDFDIELGYTLNFPSALGNEANLSPNGFFNLSIAYLIDL